MPLPEHRPFNSWIISPIHDRANPPKYWSESASTPLLLENLRRHAEIATVGRQRFPGSLSQKNKLWLEYRNFMRQALSNFQAAMSVPNRSSCLLYYYAMLNFAKAELLTVRPADIQGRVHHGLSFSPGRHGKSVAGDSLKVCKGYSRGYMNTEPDTLCQSEQNSRSGVYSLISPRWAPSQQTWAGASRSLEVSSTYWLPTPNPAGRSSC